jgi:subtilisin family serine protease
MAAPHVSGAAALILSQFPSYTVTQLRDAMLGTVDPLPALAGVTVTGGRLNVQRALLSNFTVTAVPASQTVNAGGSTTYTVTVTSIGTFTGSVTLTFSASNAGLTGSFSPGTVTVPAGGRDVHAIGLRPSSMTAGSYRSPSVASRRAKRIQPWWRWRLRRQM